ncbi:MAG TPA: hypothetical protein VM901_06960 [Bdellovibrionota bacterium]|jgi:hypothetical protein|nr:hypothetical protein [Bdellovibrionota bacterium]
MHKEHAPWSPLSLSGKVAFSATAALTTYLNLTGARWVPIVDNANLMFHEAGHLILGAFSARLSVYGGTLGQLAFPLIAMGTFARRRESLALAFASLWLVQNLWNISVYLGDAQAQLLPLVGGGDHDWTEILSRWNALARDQIYSARLREAGLVLLALVLGFLWKAPARDHPQNDQAPY